MVENHIPFNIIPLNKSSNAINEYNQLGLMPDEYAKPWIKLYNLWFDAKKINIFILLILLIIQKVFF